MKPKNRIMCPDCGRQKMLFETEKEAQTFLKFNGDAVNPDGKREMRVYYCPACCGYHISSHNYKGNNTRTDKLIERYRKESEGTIIDTIELYNQMVKQNFTTRREMNLWLKAQKQYTTKTKDRARDKFYKEGHLKKK